MYQKSQTYDAWFLKYEVRDLIFCHLGPFLPFYPPNDPENQNFEKMKKMPADIILLHMCTINEDRMMYDS